MYVNDDAQYKKSVSIYIYIYIYTTYLWSCVSVVADCRLVIPAAPRQPTLVVASRNEVELVTRGTH
jgi:hypothetical protein